MTARKGRPVKAHSLRYRARALELLLDGEELTPDRLRTVLKCTPKTARRIVGVFQDLQQRLTRTQRGLRLGGTSSYYLQSLGENIASKTAIASKLCELAKAKPVRSAACGPGTTVALSAMCLRQEGACPVIVTSNLGVIDMVSERGVGTIELTGGMYDASTHGCVGRAADGFGQAKCEAAIVGVSGIDSTGGLHVAHSSEVPVLRALLRAATRWIYIVFDSTKIGQTDTFRVTTIDELLEDITPKRTIHLVTNALEDGDAHHATLRGLSGIKGVEVCYAAPQ